MGSRITLVFLCDKSVFFTLIRYWLMCLWRLINAMMETEDQRKPGTDLGAIALSSANAELSNG